MMRFLLLSILVACWSRHVAAQMCQACGIGYEMTKDASFSDGAKGKLTCKDLVAFAGDRKQNSDVCSIIINYARQNCGCVNSVTKEPAPQLPATSLTSVCNPCGGSGGSDLHTMDRSKAVQEKLVFSGITVGTTPWSLYCEDLWEGTMDPDGGQGYITSKQCPQVQNANVRRECGCALRDASGNLMSTDRNIGSSPPGNPPGPPPPGNPPPPPPPAPPANPPPGPPPGPPSGPSKCGGTSKPCSNDDDCCGSKTCMIMSTGKGYCSAGRRGLRAASEHKDELET